MSGVVFNRDRGPGPGGVIAAAVLPIGLGWPLAILGVLLLLLAAMLWEQIRRAGIDATPSDGFDERPADGVVPIVSIAGLVGRPNEIRPEIKAFRTLDPDAGLARSRGRKLGRPLMGRLGVFSVFVGRDGASWDDREISEAYRSLEKMGRWLEREAARWTVPLNVELIDTYFAADDPTVDVVEIAPSLDPFETVLDERSADAKGVASASHAAARLGFTDLADLIIRVDPRADQDATIWIVHLLRSGRSSAVTPDMFGFPGVGIVLCYARDSAFSEPLSGLPYVDPSTLAHEALHLFGATDKYGTSLQTFARRSVTASDIMRLGKSRLSRLTIDPMTAREIGWALSVGQRKHPSSTRG